MALPCGQYVAWDTETCGIPKTRVRPTRENLSKFDDARIVSLSAVKFSSRGREIDTFNRIIKPIGYQVGATHIHGITHEYAEEHGVPFKTAFQEFIEFIGDRCNIRKDGDYKCLIPDRNGVAKWVSKKKKGGDDVRCEDFSSRCQLDEFS